MALELAGQLQPPAQNDGAELLQGGVEILVDDEVVGLGVWDISCTAPASRRWMMASSSCPRWVSRARRLSREGGRMKIEVVSGLSWRTWAAPCQSISSTTSLPRVSTDSTQL